MQADREAMQDTQHARQRGILQRFVKQTNVRLDERGKRQFEVGLAVPYSVNVGRPSGEISIPTGMYVGDWWRK